MAKINAQGTPSDVTAEFAEGGVYDTREDVDPFAIDEPVEEVKAERPAAKPVQAKTGGK